jgi:cytochrome c-type biogenesis protein CcsB
VNRRFINRVVVLSLAISAVLGVARLSSAQDAPTTTAAPRSALDINSSSEFSKRVNLAPLSTLAVYHDGRVKSFDSYTRGMMQFVTGARSFNNQSAGFTYLDMMFRPQRYADADVVYIKQKDIRAQIARALRQSVEDQFDAMAAQIAGGGAGGTSTPGVDPRMSAFMKSGLISPAMLQDPKVHELLDRLSTDLLKTAKFIDAIQGALNVMDAESLRANLRIVAPPGGGFNDRWLTIDELSDPRLAELYSKLDPTVKDQLIAQWSALAKAWQDQDSEGVNDAAAQLGSLLPSVNSAIYPQQTRLKWENFYFNAGNLTWIWLIYAFSTIFLLLGVVFRWGPARFIGLSIFTLAFLTHTFAVGLRWYVSGRWPNSNMFEAVTTAAWMGGCLAMILEITLRKSPTRNLYALGSAVACMCALMAVRLYPLELTADINNRMPVLNDIWLYIHTNVIIFSYCLIFMAAIVAVIYLGYRLVALLMDFSSGYEMQYARVGGAGSLIMTRPDGSNYLESSKTTFGQVLDGTTMVMMEMSFILLWTGLVMGAIWADHSWGRPWGWDPKEVFALNTFIIFLLLVHVRLKVKDKGLWTALLAVLGAAVMLFNWIIINFAISGLHSYA